MKVDPYNHKQRWENWKSKSKIKMKNISKENAQLVCDFLSDMEIGRNVSPNSKKGARSFIRLNALKHHLYFITKHFKKNLLSITEKEIMKFFDDLRTGKTNKANGEQYIGVGDIVKDFKCFWNWALRTKRTKGNIILYLSRSDGIKPAWVYLEEEKMQKLIKSYPQHLRAIILLLYDSGMRVTEANSIRVCDFEENFHLLNIPDEVSKTFGRKIQLTFSREAIMNFIRENHLHDADRIFLVSPAAFNKNLRRAASLIFPNKLSPARENYHKFTLYDIRHNAACYWANKYSSTRGLMYRFGWKKEEQALYYHEFLGYKDDISSNKNIEMKQLQEKVDFLINIVQNQPFLNREVATPIS